jgi:hypothetical protein
VRFYRVGEDLQPIRHRGINLDEIKGFQCSTSGPHFNSNTSPHGTNLHQKAEEDLNLADLTWGLLRFGGQTRQERAHQMSEQQSHEPRGRVILAQRSD